MNRAHRSQAWIYLHYLSSDQSWNVNLSSGDVITLQRCENSRLQFLLDAEDDEIRVQSLNPQVEIFLWLWTFGLSAGFLTVATESVKTRESMGEEQEAEKRKKIDLSHCTMWGRSQNHNLERPEKERKETVMERVGHGQRQQFKNNYIQRAVKKKAHNKGKSSVKMCQAGCRWRLWEQTGTIWIKKRRGNC